MLKLDPEGVHLDPLLPRPMAIYRREQTRLEFRFKIVGRGTRALSELSPGAKLGVTGPLGNGFPPPRGRALLVGGGTGIASLYELARDAKTPPTVLLGGRGRADILGLEDFEKLSIDLRITTEDGSLGQQGLVTELLAPAAGDEVYACGPHAMMRAVWELAREAGAACRVSLETNMACGFGICLGCVVPARSTASATCARTARCSTAMRSTGRSWRERSSRPAQPSFVVCRCATPLLLASGACGYGTELEAFRRPDGASAVMVAKSLTLEPRIGQSAAAHHRDARREC